MGRTPPKYFKKILTVFMLLALVGLQACAGTCGGSECGNPSPEPGVEVPVPRPDIPNEESPDPLQGTPWGGDKDFQNEGPAPESEAKSLLL